MSALESALIGYALVGCLYWAWILWGTLRLVRGVPALWAESPGEPERWPRLSVIVPACNEGRNLDAAARTLLAQDYPDLELILIDDRSTDDTGEVVDRLAGGWTTWPSRRTCGRPASCSTRWLPRSCARSAWPCAAGR